MPLALYTVCRCDVKQKPHRMPPERSRPVQPCGKVPASYAALNGIASAPVSHCRGSRPASASSADAAQECRPVVCPAGTVTHAVRKLRLDGGLIPRRALGSQRACHCAGNRAQSFPPSGTPCDAAPPTPRHRSLAARVCRLGKTWRLYSVSGFVAQDLDGGSTTERRAARRRLLLLRALDALTRDAPLAPSRSNSDRSALRSSPGRTNTSGANCSAAACHGAPDHDRAQQFSDALRIGDGGMCSTITGFSASQDPSQGCARRDRWRWRSGTPWPQACFAQCAVSGPRASCHNVCSGSGAVIPIGRPPSHGKTSCSRRISVRCVSFDLLRVP